MDPITLIVTALAAGAALGLQDTASSMIKDAYASLKALTRRRLGSDPGSEMVLARHEQAPQTWQAPLMAELTRAGADGDGDLIAAAKALLDLAGGAGAAGKYTVDARGAQGVQIGDGGRQDNVFNAPADGASPRLAAAGGAPVDSRSGEDGGYSVDARGGTGVQVGEGNTQIIYTYNRLTWTDGVAPPPLVSVSGAVDSPYRGLGAFEEQDAAFFFGREEAATQLLERMSRLLNGTGLLVVSGVSGAGKSSLLRAGVLPRIRGAGLASAPGAASWPCLVFTPGRAPLDELAVRVAALAGADAAAVRRGLEADPGGFALTARQAALRPQPAPGGEPTGLTDRRSAGPPRLLLIVDQFEQLFTQCADDGQRQRFIAALGAAAGSDPKPDHAPAALVVLGVRADFEARCANYPALVGPVQDRYLVTAMTERQLRMAVNGPAKQVGSQVDDDLVEVLLAEVRSRQPGAAGSGVLPLLSHALDQAWRSRTGLGLTLADYERTGGIEGAVADSAQRAYVQLSPGQQAAARQVFTRLTAASSDGMDTADRATKAELTEGKSPAGADDVAAVLEAFAGERLLTLAADSVEISHEVLLTAWPLLRDTWLTETHADRIVRTRLHTTSAEWARQGRDPSYLYSGSLLQAAAETAARSSADPVRNPPLSQTERDFLSASDHARRNTARTRRAVIAVLLALTLTAIVTAGIAVSNAANAHRQAADAARQAAEAARQHAIALSRLLADESLNIDSSDPVTARRLAAAAWRISPTQQASSALAILVNEQQADGILPADPSQATAVSFSPVGELLASAYADGTLRLWDPLTGQCVRTIQADATGQNVGVNAVAFSHDGQLLASADANGTVRLWNPVTGQLAHEIPAPPGGASATGVAFSTDGRLLAGAYSDGTVRLWDPVTGLLVHLMRADTTSGQSPPGVNGVAFSPVGELLATADNDGQVRLWNPLTGLPIRAIKAESADISDGITTVAFSANGRLLASGDSAGNPPQLWDPATGHPVPVSLTNVGGAENGVAFDPVGDLLAGADSFGTVALWDRVTGRSIRTIQPANEPTTVTGLQSGNGVAFSPGGQMLASADPDGTVRLRDPLTGLPVRTIEAGAATPGDQVTGMALSPDGKLLATSDADGTVRLWDPLTGQPVRTIQADVTGPNTGVNGVAFSPVGELLATADGDGMIRLWDPLTGGPLRTIHAYLPVDQSLGGGVSWVAFNPAGTLLASADTDGTVRLWDPATGLPVRTIVAYTPGDANTPEVSGVAFGPGGTLLASADVVDTMRVWDSATGRFLRTIQDDQAGENGNVNGVAFSPVGGLLASADADGMVRLWDPATGGRVRAIQAETGPNANVKGVAFSPDGTLLASADANGTVGLWDPVTGQAVSMIQADTTGTNAGVNEVAFSRDGTLLVTADADGTVRLWDVSLFTDPYQALCAEAGPPTRQEWKQYAPGEPQPEVCA